MATDNLLVKDILEKPLEVILTNGDVTQGIFCQVGFGDYLWFEISTSSNTFCTNRQTGTALIVTGPLRYEPVADSLNDIRKAIDSRARTIKDIRPIDGAKLVMVFDGVC